MKQHFCPGFHFIGDKASILHGRFVRSSDGCRIQRYFCKGCRSTYSRSTFSVFKYVKKRSINNQALKLLSIGVTLRGSARFLNVNHKTMDRRLIALGRFARTELKKDLRALFKTHGRNCIKNVQFDELETFEHTKCKPVAVAVAVVHSSRRILGFRVSSMPAKGPLAEISQKKYGKRANHRARGLNGLMRGLKTVIHPEAVIRSDKCPLYPEPVKKYFPDSKHEVVKSRRACTAGQGEMKKIGNDPLFSLNHTCAMYRAGTSRLIRRTWSTTKKIERLRDHLAIYSLMHNRTRVNQLAVE